MFERKFEFTVYHRIEVCEERILDMENSGCFPFFPYPISTDVVSYEGYSNISMRRLLGHGNEVQIQAVIKKINSGAASVSGVANPIGFQKSIVFLFVVSGLFWCLLTLLLHDWHLLVIGIIVSLVNTGIIAIQAIQYRNRFINMLEKALTQPKKKRA